MLLANVDTFDVKLKAGMQIASFEDVEGQMQKPTAVGAVNALLKLEESDEFVKVGDNLIPGQIQDLRDVFNEYRNAFSINGKIGLSSEDQHYIELLDPRPIVEKARRHPPQHVQEARRQVHEMLADGIVEHSSSP